MNTLSHAAVLLLAMTLLSATVSAGENQAATAAKTMVSPPPLACNAFTMSPEMRKRHFDELGPTLLKLRTATRELTDGYEFQFPADHQTYQLLTEWIFQERLCCPFFTIDLRLESGNGPAWLRLTGGADIKKFLQSDPAGWLSQ